MKLATLPKSPILTLKIAGRYPAGSGYYGRPGTAPSDWKRSLVCSIRLLLVRIFNMLGKDAKLVSWERP